MMLFDMELCNEFGFRLFMYDVLMNCTRPQTQYPYLICNNWMKQCNNLVLLLERFVRELYESYMGASVSSAANKGAIFAIMKYF